MIQVRRYMEYLHKEEEKDNENCLILIDKLNSELHKEVQKDVYGKLMRKHKIFKKFSRPLQEELSLLFKEK